MAEQTDFSAFLRQELHKEYDKLFLETVTGPDIYGPGNFEVYLENDKWEIKPSKCWIPPKLRGIFNTEE
jgi:hypothetical protein